MGLETENTGNHARDVSGWQKRREHMAFKLFKSSNKISCRLMVVYQCVCVGEGRNRLLFVFLKIAVILNKSISSKRHYKKNE